MISLDFPNAITSEDRFYGRRQELSQIEARIITDPRVPVIVVGERRVGKTSIFNLVLQRLKGAPSGGLVPISIEPRGIQSVDQFVEGILNRLSARLPAGSKSDLWETGLVGVGNRVHIEQPDQIDAAFARLVPDFSAQRFVLCVDEFDELIRIAGEAGPDERMKLMGLIYHLVEKTEVPISLFLTMTSLPEGENRQVASALLGKCEVVELAPFAFKDVSEMVLGLVQGQAAFTPAELEWLYAMAGGHPYITKLLLSNLFQRTIWIKQPVQINQGMLLQALNDSIDDPRAHYALENIYRVHLNADEKRVLLYLAERDEPIEAGELRVAGISSLTAARNLEKRHYLIERSGEYLLRAQFLGHWLRNWAEFDEEIERLRVHRMVSPWLDEDEAQHSSSRLDDTPASDHPVRPW